MSRTNGDSKKMDIVVNFMSWEKENERGIVVNNSNKENEIFTEILEFPTSNSILLENGDLIEKKYNTTILNFEEIKDKKDFEQRKQKIEKMIKISERKVEKEKQSSKDNGERVG